MKTKDKIVAAAKTVFHQKGFEGARMQEIADACGINKALLHYHFTSKENLFKAVLLSGVIDLFPTILVLLNSEKALQEKIANVVDLYVETIAKTPKLPLFVLNELNQNPNFILDQFKGVHQKPLVFIAQVEDAVAQKKMHPIGPFHLIADIIGLCVFPFLAKPMLQMISGMTEKEFAQFIAERKAHVTQILLNGLFIVNKNS